MPDTGGAEPDNGGGGPDRTKLGFLLVIIGIVAVLAAFGLAMLRWKAATDVAAGLAPITGVIGSLVGAFFGLQLGAEGKEKAEKAKDEEAKKVQSLAAVARPSLAADVLGVKREVVESLRAQEE